MFLFDRLIERFAEPGDIQLADIIFVDLIERRILRATRVATIVAPFARLRAILSEAMLRGGAHDPTHEQKQKRNDRGLPDHVGLHKIKRVASRESARTVPR